MAVAVMALVMCYVLVSPLVPTPNALGKTSRSYVPFVAIITVLVTSVPLARICVAAEDPVELSTSEVLALTCSRLC
jgi:hypothetical protein